MATPTTGTAPNAMVSQATRNTVKQAPAQTPVQAVAVSTAPNTSPPTAARVTEQPWEPYGFQPELVSLLKSNSHQFDAIEETSLTGILRGFAENLAKDLMAIGAAVHLAEERLLKDKTKEDKTAFYAKVPLKYALAMKARRTYLRFKDALDEYHLYGPSKAAILSKYPTPEERKEVWDEARDKDEKPTQVMLEKAVRNHRKVSDKRRSAKKTSDAIRLDAITERTPLPNNCQLYCGEGFRGVLILDQQQNAKELRRLAQLASSLSGARVVYGPEKEA